MSYLQQIANQNFTDYQLLLQNDILGQSARESINETNKVYNPVEQEIIDEYNKQFMKGYKKGDKTFEFDNSLEYPELESFKEIPLPINDDEIEKEIDANVEEMKKVYKELDDIKSKIEDLKDHLNKASKGERTKYNKQIGNYQKREEDLKTYLTKLDNDIQVLRKQKDDNNVIRNQNSKDYERIKKSNRDKVGEYTSKMNVLNSGKFSIEQSPGENDEDYFNRVQQNANREIVDNTLEEGKWQIQKEFRMKLKELIRVDWMIESVANSIDKFDSVDNKLYILKHWAGYKKQYDENLGINNKYLSVDDIIENMKSFIAGNNPTKNSSKSTLMTKANFNNLRIVEMKQYLEDIGLKNFQNKRKDELKRFYANYLKQQGIDSDNSDSEEEIPTVRIRTQKTGVGINVEHIPDYTTFGNVIILTKKLYYKNILAVKWHNKVAIQGFPNVKVSDELVNIILRMCKNIYPKAGELQLLHTKEKYIYDRLIQLSGIHKIVPHSIDKTTEDLKNRLKVIEGELMAGNDNQELFSEMYKILYALKDFNVISVKQIKDYLGQFYQK